MAIEVSATALLARPQAKQLRLTACVPRRLDSGHGMAVTDSLSTVRRRASSARPTTACLWARTRSATQPARHTCPTTCSSMARGQRLPMPWQPTLARALLQYLARCVRASITCIPLGASAELQTGLWGGKALLLHALTPYMKGDVYPVSSAQC